MHFRRWWTGSAAAVAIAIAAPRSAEAQRPVIVNIESVPSGATVRVDSESAAPLGTTPLRRVRVPGGNHTLYFTRDGYMPQPLQVSVRRRNETFTATMTQSGAIYVSADIDGAQIILDGNQIGTTPGRINNVAPGQHVVEIRHSDAQPFRETVTVGAGAVASVNATLRPRQQPTGIVRVIVTNPNGPIPADLSVTFDGSPMTGTPPSVENATPGQHIVQISAGGFRTVRREVAVTGGQTFALAVDLEAVQQAVTGGTVRVLLNTEGATALLDGEVLEGTPPQRANVPPGTHSLRVTATGRRQFTREITVTAGQTTVVDVPELEVQAQVGRLRVISNTPGAHVFVDGRDMGEAPYERADMPVGNYEILVRAPGHDDRTQQCTLTTSSPCEYTLTLTRTVGRATLRVELARPIRGAATVLIDGQEVGEIGAGRDVPNITATTHEIRVRATGYQDHVESLTLQEGESRQLMVTMRRDLRGPSGAEIGARRTAISTFGASPLSQRDAAFDAILAYGSYPAEVRFATGFLPYGMIGLDGGFSIRSMGIFWELELRSRFGVRFANGLLAVGAELRGFAGTAFAGQNNFGGSARAIFSIHSTAPTNDQDEENIEDPNERSNRLGSFSFSLFVGVEGMRDGLNGFQATRENGTLPRIGDRPMGFTGNAWDVPEFQELCRNGMGQACGVVTRMGSTERFFEESAVQASTRPIFGATFELSLSRHINIFAQVERILSGSASMRRLYYAVLWFGNDPLTYIRAGLTYKF